MTRDPSAALSLAVFFQQSRDWRPTSVEAASHALIREGRDDAATLGDDPLRGDPDDEQHRSLVELIRPADAVRCPRCETVPILVTPDTVPVLVPGELTPAQVRDRAGMVGTVWVLAAVLGVALGVLWAWAGGVL